MDKESYKRSWSGIMPDGDIEKNWSYGATLRDGMKNERDALLEELDILIGKWKKIAEHSDAEAGVDALYEFRTVIEQRQTPDQ